MTGLMAESFNIGSINITMQQLITLGITILLMVLLQFIVKKTRIGKAMRAVSLDQDAAMLMGNQRQQYNILYFCPWLGIGGSRRNNGWSIL